MSGHLTSACGGNEISSASKYWVSMLRSDGLAPQQLSKFSECLMRNLIHKYNGHWFAECPERGQAFRSLLFDQYSCPRLVLEAAKQANITDLHARLPAHPFVMWVDPGSVTVKSLVTNHLSVLYAAEEPTMVNSEITNSRFSAKSRSFAPSSAIMNQCATEFTNVASYYPNYEAVAYMPTSGRTN